MMKKLNIFNIVTITFLSIFITILILIIIDSDALFFNGNGIAERIVQSDLERTNGSTDSLSSPIPSDSMLRYVWKWKSAVSDRSYLLEFELPKSGLISSKENRTNENWSSIEEVYRSLSSHDVTILQPMITAFINLAKSQRLNYMESMEMVVSSIQSIDYTWVLDRNPSCGESIPTTDGGNIPIPSRNCVVLRNGGGCCDGINWGVFSPVEFVTGKKGDCDTRSVLAYTVLRKMGYDVAVMLRPGHSVLGVNVPMVPGDAKKGNVGDAKNYYLWELTAFGPKLGEYIYGNDWYIGIK
jgi:hypothetical protein